jgi:8-oxo-dGTP diphosphatase
MPEATVAAIISASHQGAVSVLLTRRSVDPFKDQWCLPGGHIDPYEPARQAIVREVKEETGLDFDARFLNWFDEIIPERNIHAIVLVFEGEASGQLDLPVGEVSDAGWFPLAEACSMPLAFAHDDILAAYAARIKKSR